MNIPAARPDPISTSGEVGVPARTAENRGCPWRNVEG